MAGNDMHTYIVFREGECTPIAVDLSAEECAKIMGINTSSFHSMLGAMRKGEVKKWRVFMSVDCTLKKNLPDTYLCGQTLSNTDIKIIRSLQNKETVKEIAEKLFFAMPNIRYHFKKIRRVTGLDPRNNDDLGKLCEMYLDGGK